MPGSIRATDLRDLVGCKQRCLRHQIAWGFCHKRLFQEANRMVGQTFLSAFFLMRDDATLRVSHRRLPHWRLKGSTYFVTFRLREGRLDAGEISLVREHILSGDGQYYELVALVVMPNQVHLVLAPGAGFSLSRILKGIKGVTARQINGKRGVRGRLWQDESFDRIVRDQAELHEKLEYMLENPVKAGVTVDPWQYPGWYVKRQ